MWFLSGLVVLLLFQFGESQTTPVPKPIWNNTWTDKLKNDLLLTYDKYARPTEHFNVTEVELGLTILHLDIDEQQSILSTHCWIKMSWTDSKLRWNVSDYGNLSIMRLSAHEIWQPDIVLFNNAAGNDIDHYGNTNVIVDHNGSVLWVPPTMFETYCELDLKKWPYDVQICRIVLGSWTFDGYQMDLKIATSAISLEPLVKNHEWEIIRTTARRNSKVYTCCKEPYIDIQFELELERRSSLYRALVITPATCIVLMTLAGFWLPVQSGEKIMLNGVNAIITCLFLIYFARRLSTSANDIPLVVYFYSSSLYLICFSAIVSVAVINMSRNRQTSAVPRIIRELLNGCLGTCLGLKLINLKVPRHSPAEEMRDPPFEDHSTEDHHQMINETSQSSNHRDWILFATAIDRIMFLLYCFIFIIIAIMYSV